MARPRSPPKAGLGWRDRPSRATVAPCGWPPGDRGAAPSQGALHRTLARDAPAVRRLLPAHVLAPAAAPQLAGLGRLRELVADVVQPNSPGARPAADGGDPGCLTGEPTNPPARVRRGSLAGLAAGGGWAG